MSDRVATWMALGYTPEQVAEMTAACETAPARFAMGGLVEGTCNEDTPPSWLAQCSNGMVLIPESGQKYAELLAALNGGNTDVYTVPDDEPFPTRL